LKRHFFIFPLAGFLAGSVNGLFGGGGGMILVPLLGWLGKMEGSTLFSSSIAIIGPICIVSILATAINGSIPWQQSVPWLIGSAIGGFAAGKWGQKIPALWLHKGLGLLILYGGVRYLC